MAFVGHALVGLSLAGLEQSKSRNWIRYAWPGIVVLLAYLVDVVESIVWAFSPDSLDHHFLTNSPLLTSGLVLLVWIVMALSGQFRKLWPYLIAALAIFSHLLLDHRLVRATIGDAYGFPVGEYLPGGLDALQAEIWLYGFVLVGVALFRAAMQPNCPFKGRATATVLALLSIIAVATRISAFWASAYMLSLAHAAILLRREVRLRLLWSLVPLLPLGVLFGIESTGAWYCSRARELARQGDPRGAIELRRQVLAIPARSIHIENYIGLGDCYLAVGELELAEKFYVKAQSAAKGDYTPSYYLARFYTDERCRNTPFFRPEKARQLLLEIRDGPHTERVRIVARKVLEEMRNKALFE